MYKSLSLEQFSMFVQSIRHVRFFLDWPIFGLCIAGGILALRQRQWFMLFWLSIPALSYYVTFMGVVGYNYVRFFLPIVVILAFWGATAMEYLYALRGRIIGSLGKLAVLAAIAYSLLYASAVDVAMVADPRYHVEAWMRQNIPQHTPIAAIGLIEYLPRQRDFDHMYYLLNPSFEKISALRPEYLITSSSSCSCQYIYDWVAQEQSEYEQVLQYQKIPVIGALIYHQIYRGDEKQIFTNFDKLFLEIRIFQRKRNG